MGFSSDGMKLFVVEIKSGTGVDMINQFDLECPYGLAACVSDASASVVSQVELANQNISLNVSTIFKRFEWIKLMENYFKNRSNLSRVFILIDARRGIKNSDHELMGLLNVVAVNFQCILTKIDKISSTALREVTESTLSQTEKYAASFPEILQSSSNKKIGCLLYTSPSPRDPH